jgi:hypothetical protein
MDLAGGHAVRWEFSNKNGDIIGIIVLMQEETISNGITFSKIYVVHTMLSLISPTNFWAVFV